MASLSGTKKNKTLLVIILYKKYREPKRLWSYAVFYKFNDQIIILILTCGHYVTIIMSMRYDIWHTYTIHHDIVYGTIAIIINTISCSFKSVDLLAINFIALIYYKNLLSAPKEFKPN
jgi:hypothetical protein